MDKERVNYSIEPLKWREEFERVRFPSAPETFPKALITLVVLGIVMVCLLGLIIYILSAGALQLSHLVMAAVLCTAAAGSLLLMYKQQWASSWAFRWNPLRLRCPECGKFIPADIEWQCGVCDERNSDTRTFSFLYKCEICGSAPKAYRCQHCTNVIFLDPDNDEKHCATMFEEPTPKTEKPIAESRKEQLEEINFQVTVTRMNTELERAKRDWILAQALNKEKSRSSGSELEKSFKATWNRSLEIHRVASRQRKKSEAEHADNPQMLERELMMIEDWVAQELGKVE